MRAHWRHGSGTDRRPARRALRGAAASLAALHLFSACYSYVPLRSAPSAGAAMALDLSDEGRVTHAAALGPGVARVAGTLRATDGDRYVVDVASVTPIRGHELPVSGITVSFAPRDVSDVRTRIVSRRRTAMVIGVALATVVVFLATKGFRSGHTPPEGPPGPGGPDQ